MADSKIYVARFFFMEIEPDFEKIARTHDLGNIMHEGVMLFADFKTADKTCRWFAKAMLENLQASKCWDYRLEHKSLGSGSKKSYSIFQIRDIDGMIRSLQAADFLIHEAVFEPDLLVDSKLMEATGNAIWKNDLATLKKLVGKGLSVNSKFCGDMPLLSKAVESERETIVEYLLKKGASPNVSQICESPIKVALLSGNFRLFKMLLKHGAKIDYGKIDELELFESYHCHKNLAFTRFLVENGANVNAKDENGWTVLHWAAENGHLELVKFLVEKGADPNAKNKNGVDVLCYVKGKRLRRYLEKAMARVKKVREKEANHKQAG